jgi:acetylornithine deacetylase/succinyl-diaminopimelate desuccinylase-like protein
MGRPHGIVATDGAPRASEPSSRAAVYSPQQDDDRKVMEMRGFACRWMLFAGCALSLQAHADDDALIKAAQANMPEFLQLLSIPNVADDPGHIRDNAVFIEAAFNKRGFRTRLLQNPAKRPMVFAQLDAPVAGRRTVLFYIHFDGQPVIPERWSQPSPFSPVVKQRDADGVWTQVPNERLQATPFDPELRIFARSASDDKAPIMMLLTAIDLLNAEGVAPSLNIKLILDSEEEMGSPSLAGVVASNRSLFAADALVILDGPAHASGRPTLVFGNRGIAQAKLVVYGPKVALHSGHYANYAPNPAMRLSRLLASMKDDDGRVLVPGYYDGIDLTASDRALLAASGDDEVALRKRLGIAKAESVGDTYQAAMQYPSLNVRGMASAAVGDKAANIVPSEAMAELDLRTTPEADGQTLFALLKRHIERQGYHLTDGPPSDEARAAHDKLASITLGAVEKAVRMPVDAPVGRWAYAAAQAAATAGDTPVRIRMVGGTVPTATLVDALHLPFVIVSTVNTDNNQHTHDENLRMGHFISGTRTIGSLLMTPYP